MQKRLCTERERGPQKGAVGWRWMFMPFLPSCYCPFLSCSVTRKSCSHCAHQKVFERGSLWCWRWHREIFLILCPALTSFYSCQSKGCSSCKWEKSSTEIFVKRQKIYKRLRESRVQLLQRMVKVRKQRGVCWKIHKCQSPCSALSPPLCPYQRCSVLGLTDQSPEQSPAPAQHRRKSCCLFKSLTFISLWEPLVPCFSFSGHTGVQITEMLSAYNSGWSWGELGFEQAQCGYPEKSHTVFSRGAFCSLCLHHMFLWVKPRLSAHRSVGREIPSFLGSSQLPRWYTWEKSPREDE